VRFKRVWARLLGVEHTIIEAGLFDDTVDAVDAVVVLLVRPAKSRRRRCGICDRKSPGYDQGEGRRRCGRSTLGGAGVP
jgi:transposase